MLVAHKKNIVEKYREINKEVKDGIHEGRGNDAEVPMPPEWQRAKVAFAAGTAAALTLCIPDVDVVPFLARSLEATSIGGSIYAGLYIGPMLFPKFGRVAEPTRNFVNSLYTKALAAEQRTQKQAVRGAQAVVHFASPLI